MINTKYLETWKGWHGLHCMISTKYMGWHGLRMISTDDLNGVTGSLA